MKKLFIFSHVLALALLVTSVNVLALDMTQVVTESTDGTLPIAVDQPKAGSIVLFTPEAAIKWAEKNKANPMARLAVYYNPNFQTYAQLYGWWRLQKTLKAEAEKAAAQ